MTAPSKRDSIDIAAPNSIDPRGSGAVPTRRIVDPDVPGGRLINAADFDPAIHEDFEATK